MNESPNNQEPVVFILHGDDPLSIRRELGWLVQQMEDPAFADLNTIYLDGSQASEDELFNATNSLPFMGGRRVVVLTHPFDRIQKDAARKRFKALLDNLPSSTALVLIVDDEFDRKKDGSRDWLSLPNKNTFWMRKWMIENGKRVSYKLLRPPVLKDMPAWIMKETVRIGGRIDSQAASALVGHVGNDTMMASQEIEKLLTYVDFKRPIEIEDVEDMTAQSGQPGVFDMVDSLAEGNARQALAKLHSLLETQEVQGLFVMIVRQFRLLIIARELLDEGRGGQEYGELRPQFVAEKVTSQAQRFTMRRLEELYHRLLLIDEASKTSQMPLDLALDTFVTDLAR